MTGNPFAGKKATIMGLGLLGGALNDAIFLAEHGAELLVTDLKSAEELKTSVDKLKEYTNIEFVLGEHRLKDFSNADFILQPGNVPLNSPYLAEARKNGIPVHVSESLFFEYLPAGVKTIGITGTRGKSTTARLIFDILAARASGAVYLAGNTKGVSTLALLDQVKAGDTVVTELDSWALHGLGEIGKSPNLAIFTNFMTDHQNFYGGGEKGMDLYFADKAQIFLHQQAGDKLVCGPEVVDLIKEKYPAQAGRATVAGVETVPVDWHLKLPGAHNRLNVALAVAAARESGIGEEVIKKTVEAFAGVPGRLELVAEKEGIKYYNDTTATTPEACIAAVNALSQNKNIVLVSGGTDKALDFTDYAKLVPPKVKALVLFRGTATEKILEKFQISKDESQIEYKFENMPVVVVDNMQEALNMARKYAQTGDTILLSPGAASFGIFNNEFDRGEQFVQLVK